jgi:hypothetical protein
VEVQEDIGFALLNESVQADGQRLADGILSPVYFAVLVHVIVVEIGGEISV